MRGPAPSSENRCYAAVPSQAAELGTDSTPSGPPLSTQLPGGGRLAGFLGGILLTGDGSHGEQRRNHRTEGAEESRRRCGRPTQSRGTEERREDGRGCRVWIRSLGILVFLRELSMHLDEGYHFSIERCAGTNTEFLPCPTD